MGDLNGVPSHHSIANAMSHIFQLPVYYFLFWKDWRMNGPIIIYFYYIFMCLWGHIRLIFYKRKYKEVVPSFLFFLQFLLYFLDPQFYKR